MISEAFPKRILGSGTAAMTVSAIGFGAMGTTYHRGAAPEKKSLLSLFARAVELGCTFPSRIRSATTPATSSIGTFGSNLC